MGPIVYICLILVQSTVAVTWLLAPLLKHKHPPEELLFFAGGATSSESETTTGSAISRAGSAGSVACA